MSQEILLVNKSSALDSINVSRQYSILDYKNSILDTIRKLGYYEKYIQLKSTTSNKKTLSQYDWFFCLFILNFINTKASLSDCTDILKEFLRSECPKRDKMVCDDYMLLTSSKFIESAQQNDLLGLKLKYSNSSQVKKTKNNIS